MWMPGTRWKKVIQDLKFNKTRSILTMLSITVGVFAVGVLTTYGQINFPDMQADYQSANPSSARIYTSPFDESFIRSAREVEGVENAEGRRYIDAQLISDQERRIPITITGIQNDNSRINLLKFEGAPIQLNKKEILFERSAITLGLKQGDLITIETQQGKNRTLIFKGYVHDVSVISYLFSSCIPAYVSPETIEWLGGPVLYNELLFTVKTNKTDENHVGNIANEISDKLKKANIEVQSIYNYSPGRHFAYDLLSASQMIFTVLGWFTVLLSAFLVINTINALMAQHVRQIGLMKSIGGQTGQIFGMYLVLIFSFGFLAFVIAVPLSSYLGYVCCQFSAAYVNFDLRPFRFIPEAWIQQAWIAFIFPVLASLVPILGGLRVTVREAVADYGMGQKDQTGLSLVDRVFEKIKFLSRPLAISLRNSIRRKGRLGLTLATLSLGGAIFIAVFNLWGALGLMIEQSEGFLLSDINIDLTKPVRIQKIESIVTDAPNVAGFEGWTTAFGQLDFPDNKNKADVNFIAPPKYSKLIHPVLSSGRWLDPEIDNEIVIGKNLINKMPGLKVGDDLTIQIKNKNFPFHIVGIYRLPGTSSLPTVYANPDYIGKITDAPDQISQIRFITTRNDIGTQNQTAKVLQGRLKEEGISISKVQTGVEWHQQQMSQIALLIYFLMVMAFLISLVGGLGLMGAMGMNILERYREIGVMRAVGATNLDIQRIVITEGICVGLASWVLGAVISFPMTFLLNLVVGQSMLDAPLDFVFGPQGLFGWLAGVIVIAALSSLLPAWNASRLTIREVLAYE